MGESHHLHVDQMQKQILANPNPSSSCENDLAVAESKHLLPIATSDHEIQRQSNPNSNYAGAENKIGFGEILNSIVAGDENEIRDSKHKRTEILDSIDDEKWSEEEINELLIGGYQQLPNPNHPAFATLLSDAQRQEIIESNKLLYAQRLFALEEKDVNAIKGLDMEIDISETLMTHFLLGKVVKNETKRWKLTLKQKEILIKYYSANRSLDSHRKSQILEELLAEGEASIEQISRWFCNKRHRDNKKA